ncbi:hypothetical protein VTO42DRAFT_7722 [Malbranchea cinnamomea]
MVCPEIALGYNTCILCIAANMSACLTSSEVLTVCSIWDFQCKVKNRNPPSITNSIPVVKVASNPRKITALVISSAVEFCFSGFDWPRAASSQYDFCATRNEEFGSGKSYAMGVSENDSGFARVDAHFRDLIDGVSGNDRVGSGGQMEKGNRE